MTHGWVFRILFCAALTVSAASGGEVAIPFEMSGDSLCFENKDERLRQYGPLGRLGAKRGVCQGIAGISAAFFEQGVFDPSLPKPTENEARALIDRFVHRHSGGCSVRETVPGFANLKDFCSAYPGVFLRKAIAYNTSIAAREIVPHLPLFYTIKREPIRTERQRRLLHETVESLRTKVREGKSPLVLVYSHVMNVVSVADRGPEVAITYYDSNDLSGFRSLTVQYAADGLPALGANRMLWDITPERAGVRCE